MALVCCLVAEPVSAGAPASGALAALARACSPRVELHDDTRVVFDAGGLTRVLGSPADIACAVRRLSAEQQITPRIALAGTNTAAWLLAHARPGTTIVDAGDEANALSRLPLGCLAVLPECQPSLGSSASGAPTVARRQRTGRSRTRARAGHYRMAPGPDAARQAPVASVRDAVVPPADYERALAVLDRWGLRTLGDLARLPRADLRARLGAPGLRLHQAACGEDVGLLVPVPPPAPFAERLVLEWPIDAVEPLSFVLSRVCDALSLALERADRGAVVITSRFRLVTRLTHERRLELPAPLRDARVLRTLILLDLESHPPEAAIDVVEVELDVVPGRIVQGALLNRAVPAAEDLATLLARLRALMGERRIGAPALVDTHDGRQSTLAPFRVLASSPRTEADGTRTTDDARTFPGVVRRFRLPVPAVVTLERGLPIRVESSACGAESGRIVAAAGPWRSSGHWWALDRSNWDRDEWDIELADGIYRLTRDRATGRWEIEGVVD